MRLLQVKKLEAENTSLRKKSDNTDAMETLLQDNDDQIKAILAEGEVS